MFCMGIPYRLFWDTYRARRVSTVVRQPGGSRHRIPPATCFRVRRRETVRSVAPAQSDLQHILLEIRSRAVDVSQQASFPAHVHKVRVFSVA